MNADYAHRYSIALRAYAAVGDEQGRANAYELGREAFAGGLGIVGLAAVHARAAAGLPSPAASEFFAETLAPFEMALRGFDEANRALREAATALEQRVAERTRLVNSVIASISDGVVVADASGKVVLFNHAGERLVGKGFTARHLKGWSAHYGVFLADEETPFPDEQLPLVQAIRGQSSRDVPMFVRNAQLPDGMHLTVAGSPIVDENGNTTGGVVVFRDVTDSIKSVDALRRSEARFRAMFDDSPLPMWTFDRGTLAFVSVNRAACELYGYTQGEFARMTIADLRPLDEAASRAPLVDEGVPGERRVARHRRKDGSLLQVETRAHDFAFDGHDVRLVLIHDVTERERVQQTLRSTEEQLRQSQKMDAIGRLAGGVAHDFNNMLTVVLGAAEMLGDGVPPEDPQRELIDEIVEAGRRASELTRQLLMFSRQQVLAPKVMDVNEVLDSMHKMLGRILGTDIELVSRRCEDLRKVRADRGSLEQVILNLVVNARDAMPRGGKLTLETANVVLDREFIEVHHGAAAGPHVMLAVSDTGVGMTKDVQARIFEPFFTTKEKGKGTGLGLSTVFGIVHQSGGTVWVYSEPGRGTSFKVYLPAIDEEVARVGAARMRQLPGGAETILLVDDDGAVRGVVRDMLRRAGYRVMEASNGAEALTLEQTHSGPLHLLLTDVVMPRMGGPTLAELLTAKRQEVRVICMSGYTDDTVFRHGLVEERISFLQKPVTRESLLKKVREVLDG